MYDDEEQRQCRKCRRQVCQHDHHSAHTAALGPVQARRARHHAGGHASFLTDTLHTSQRAIALTMMVITNSTAPTAMSAERWRSLVASLNSFAMSDAMV